MKDLHFLFFAALMSSFISCSFESKQDKMPDEDDSDLVHLEDKVNTKDTISLERFNKWRSAWENQGESYLDTASLFKYFTLPMVDLKEVLNERADSTKFYFGLDEYDKNKYTLKFMLIGLDSKGEDLIDYEKQAYVYDYSSLCPPFCNPKN